MNNVDRKLLSANVEEELVEYITKHCVSGDKLPNEYELANKYSISRSTMREIIKSLASRGLLDVRQGSGTYVRNTENVSNNTVQIMDRKDKYQLALELFDVRIMIEPEMAAKAAIWATDDAATAAEKAVEICEFMM